MAHSTDNDGKSKPRHGIFNLPLAGQVSGRIASGQSLPYDGQVGGRIVSGHAYEHGLPYDGQVSGRRRQPGSMSMEKGSDSTDDQGLIAELELMVEKKTSELNQKNTDMEILKKKLKSYEEIEWNPVHRTTEHDDVSMNAQLQLIKYQEKENEVLNCQLKERDQKLEVYQQKLKNSTDLMELQSRRMGKQDDEYRKLEKQLQETKTRCVESVGREQTLRKELDKMQQYLNDEVNEKKKLQKKNEIQSTQAINQEKRETEMQNEICQLQKQMREKDSDLENKNRRYVEAEKRLQEITKESRTTIANLNQHISAQAFSLEKQATHIERTTTKISELQSTLKDGEQKLQHSKQRSLTKDPMGEMKKRETMLVVAIDIGSSHSGYAFSFKHDFNADPTKICTNQNWVAGSMALMSLKAPTCVLFDEYKQFHSFGYNAEDTYFELASDDEHKKWYFFKQFNKVPGKLYIEDDKGRKLPAMLVYGEVIKYLKEHCLHEQEKKGALIEIADIHWVLPVPAIWSETERQLMREAAFQAGIDDEQLSIVPEPEVAALFVQYLPTDRMPGSEVAKLQNNKPGSRFMVIDLGGNTSDISVYTRQPDGGLKELHEPTGGPYGGTKIDKEFNQLLIRIVGAPVFKQFCYENIEDVLDLQREFETKKRTITPTSKGKITIKVPVSVAETYKANMGKTVKDAIENSSFDKKIQWIGDKLRIDAEIFKALFTTCCGSIVKMINDVLQIPSVKGTNIFLLVGGLSESAMVQDAIKKSFPNVHIIIPEEAGLSVLKGAVIYGHHPLSNTE